MRPTFDFSAFPILTTQRLNLRQLNHDDAQGMIDLFGSPEVLRFLSQPPLTTLEKAIGLIDWFNNSFATHEAIQWAITVTGDDRFIGTCGIYEWDRDNHYLDLGYHILPSHWGQGYATEACQAMVRWSFDNINIHRIQADCSEGNTGSEKVLLKCGFTLEGIWREKYWEHGRYINNKQFGLLDHEFRTKNAE